MENELCSTTIGMYHQILNSSAYIEYKKQDKIANTIQYKNKSFIQEILALIDEE